MNYLCLTRDIPEGKFKCFEQHGRKLVAKKSDGFITVADNICAHRSFKVAEGEGALPIKCPYHGHPFDFESELSTLVSGEFVFCGEPKGSAVPGAYPKMILGEQFGESRMFVKAPFHLWMQNTADPNHLRTVHPETFHKLFANTIPKKVIILGKTSAYCLDVAPEIVNKYSRWADPESELFKDGFCHSLCFPHLSATSFLGCFFSVETALPVGKGCEVHTRFFVAKDSKLPDLMKNMAMTNNRQILEEDRLLVERWAETYQNHQNVKWMPGEERIAAYVDQLERSGMWHRA